MLLLLILACLVVGIGLVATARRYPAQASRLERVGGGLVVIGLIGLGFALASRGG